METQHDRRIGIVGAGTKGTGIASVFARAGWDVLIFDIDGAAAAGALAAIQKTFQDAPDADRPPPGTKIRIASKPAELRDATLIVETVSELLDVKRRVLAGLEEHIAPTTLFTTNTGWLSVNEVCAQLKWKGRVAGFHFLTPPSTPVVEIIPTHHTNAGTIERLFAIARALGHAPVQSADLPGFVVAHLNRGLMGEAARLIEADVASPADIDTILKAGLGLKSGPFELYDRLGLDVLVRTADHIWRGWGGEPRFRGVPLLATRAKAGLTGRDGAAGFYPSPPSTLAKPDGGSPWKGPVYISRRHPALANAVGAVLRDARLVDKPTPDSMNIVTPVGTDAIGEIAAEGLDPTRSLGIDAFFLNPVVTLAATAVTTIDIRRGAARLIEAAGRTAVLVRDTPGLVAQRTAAMIIAVGYAMLDKGVATAIDIETVATRALGYGQGPFALSRTLGLVPVVAILDGLLQTMGDPRWRTPVNLRHAMLLGSHAGAHPATS